MKCPHCQTDMNAGASVCHACGATLEIKHREWLVFLKSALTLPFLPAAIMYIGFTFIGDPSPRATYYSWLTGAICLAILGVWFIPTSTGTYEWVRRVRSRAIDPP